MFPDSTLQNLKKSLDSFPQKNKIELCILGGTGFVGQWLVSSLLYLRSFENVDMQLHILTRNKRRSALLFSGPHAKKINWIECDLRKNVYSDFPEANYYVFGPTPSVVENSITSQLSMLKVTKNGLESMAASIARNSLRPRIVNLSSGAVYRKSRLIDSALSESDDIEEEPKSIYTRAKLESEKFLDQLRNKRKLSIIHLRLFSFFGPFLPLDKHFAIGNFMSDTLNQREIEVAGNSRTKRSYLYGADLGLAIVKSIFTEYEGPLNIGSKSPKTMFEVATEIGTTLSNPRIELKGEETEPNYYYPKTLLSEQVLGQYETTSFAQGLRSWENWLQNKNNNH